MAEEKSYADMSPEEREEYLIKHYNELTDNKTALEALRADIDARRQGYGEVWATGFTELDKKLDGGFMGEQLIFLGAISSLGKTSYALQIATQIAEQGKDVLIFSLEMSKNELNAKTISRYTHILTTGKKNEYRQKYRLTTRDILSGRVGDMVFNEPQDDKARLFVEAIDATEKIAGNIRIFVGENDVTVDKVRAVVDTHIKATRKRPFVIVDYLQILNPSDEARTTDKRLLTDYDVTRLKVVSRDYHIPVLVISAFNRTSYLEPVSMSSFRESSGIEYSSDILLAMQYDGMDYQKHWFTRKSGKKTQVFESQQDHNTRVRELLDKMDKDGSNGLELPIELKILKNRNGTKGSLYYGFLPAYNYYGEKTASGYVNNFDYGDDEDDDFLGSSSVASSGKSLGRK
jgi:replicative DNA helicase